MAQNDRDGPAGGRSRQGDPIAIVLFSSGL